MPLEPIRIGVPFTRRYTLEDEDGVIRNLSGSTFVWKIRGSNGAMLSFSSGSNIIVTAVSGIVDISLTAANTATIPANNAAETYLEETITATGFVEAKAHLYDRVVPAEAVE